MVKSRPVAGGKWGMSYKDVMVMLLVLIAVMGVGGTDIAKTVNGIKGV